jgi:hypothetical protein
MIKDDYAAPNGFHMEKFLHGHIYEMEGNIAKGFIANGTAISYKAIQDMPLNKALYIKENKTIRMAGQKLKLKKTNKDKKDK